MVDLYLETYNAGKIKRHYYFSLSFKISTIVPSPVDFFILTFGIVWSFKRLLTNEPRFKY